MDTNTNVEEKTKQDSSKHPKKGKKPGVKKPQGKPAETRGRAKTLAVSIFEQKKTNNPTIQKEIKPAETSERFKNLLSMFEKKEPEKQGSKEEQAPKNLNMAKLSIFNKGEENSASNNGPRGSAINTGGVSESIQKRISDLMNSKKNDPPKINPLEDWKKRQDETESDEEDEDEFDDEFNDHEEEKGDELNESLSDSDQEKENKDDKSDVKKNSITKSDSFDDKEKSDDEGENHQSGNKITVEIDKEHNKVVETKVEAIEESEKLHNEN